MNQMEQGLYVSGRPRFSETVDNTVSEALVLEIVDRDTNVIVSPGSGASARVEKTLSSIEDVEAGTAVWFPWSNGDVTGITETIFAPGIIALRLVVSGGSATWYVCQ